MLQICVLIRANLSTVSQEAHMLRSVRWLLLALLFVLGVAPALHARGAGDRVQVGRSIVVEENEVVGDVVCIGCSVHMMGTCGDIVTVGGSSTIEGTVKGDAVAVGGGVYLGESASVAGDVVTVGGGLSRHPNAEVKGDVTTHSGPLIFLGLVFVPLIPLVLIVALIVWLVKPNRPRAPVNV
jgi:hypothetical protein